MGQRVVRPGEELKVARSLALLLTALGDLPATVPTSGNTVLPRSTAARSPVPLRTSRGATASTWTASSGRLPGPSCAYRSQIAFAR